jgi:predicted TIM-barrel fold metal-dependent hydrolase
MKPFVFSADSHIREPNDLFTKNLPGSFRHAAVFYERTDEFILTKAGDRVLHRLKIGGNTSAQQLARRGASNLELRLEDMAMDGVDAEIVFPQIGLYLYFLDDPEIELASCQIYNDWQSAFFVDHLDRFVRCGVLPIRKQENTLSEIKRLASLGFTAAMLPVVTPAGVAGYNNEYWDPIFALAGEVGLVFVLHTGTGLETFTAEKGPGGAVINYSRQMNDGVNAVLLLTGGGVLDRNPLAKIAVIEAGASWLAAISERMDEVYHQHSFYVRPKLSILPSEIVKRQVHASFQFDRACVMSRSVTGHQALLFASDYPHMEGTFPNTRAVINRLFEGIEISEDEKLDILGRNAVRLFRLQKQPEVLHYAAAE